MIPAGDTIENPVTGERIVFHQISRKTNAEAVVFETFVERTGSSRRPMSTPGRWSASRSSRGTLGLEIGGEEIVAGPGAKLTVPVGTPHRFGYSPTYVRIAEPLGANA